MMNSVEGITASHSLVLKRMPQQHGYIGLMDDWTGITSSSERRRVQNRLNQRTYRKRKRDGKAQCPTDASRVRQATRSMPSPSDAQAVSISHRKTVDQASSLWQLFHSAIKFHKANRAKLVAVAMDCPKEPHEIQDAILQFDKWVQSRSIGSPSTENLIVLVKFNVFRALVSNCKSLGIPVHDTLDDDGVSPFPSSTHSQINPMGVPSALWPTDLQKGLPHHPWIDLLPLPRMRDNLLQAGDAYDEEQLCTDIIGACSGDIGTTGMIIWGEPWDPAGWEVTEQFVQRWGWTLKGCHQLAASTNSWRLRRGEDPLKFEEIHRGQVVD